MKSLTPQMLKYLEVSVGNTQHYVWYNTSMYWKLNRVLSNQGVGFQKGRPRSLSQRKVRQGLLQHPCILHTTRRVETSLEPGGG